MATYVVLAFSKDTDAEDFVQEHLNLNEERNVQGSLLALRVPYLASATIRGVFKKPIAFCECGHKNGFSRGKKYGWWVCVDCGKPTKLWARGDMWYSALGTNLLPKQCMDEEEWRAPNWKTDAEWTWLLDEV